jgi:hypothetical protein
LFRRIVTETRMIWYTILLYNEYKYIKQ